MDISILKVNDNVEKKSKKPFKSGEKTATIKELTTNPHTNYPAALLKEDNTIVDLRQLIKVDDLPEVKLERLRKAATPSMKKFRKECKDKYCFYCGMNLNSKTETSPNLRLRNKSVDHYIPLSKGGCIDFSNLRMSCFRCNTDKTDIHPIEDSDLWQLFNQFIEEKAKKNMCFRFHHFLANKYCRLENKPN